jgi:division/cell wall cluster transcriptional repressor MraZ
MFAFSGEFEHNVDGKGRLIIPAKFRPALDAGYFLTKGLDGCLWLFPQATWAEMGDKLKAFEDRYQVDRHILLAIWGMESNFGKDKGSMSVMRSLATPAATSASRTACARSCAIVRLRAVLPLPSA